MLVSSLQPKKRTSLVGPVRTKIESAVNFLEMPNSRVKERDLELFRRNLQLTKNPDIDGFDSDVWNAMAPYALDKEWLSSEITYLKHLKDAEGLKFSRCLWVYEKTSDAWNSFASANYTSFRWNANYQRSLEFWRDYLVKRRGVTPLKTLVFTRDAEVEAVLPKSNTHSGFMFLETGRKKKGENMDGIVEKVKYLEEYGLRSGNFDRPVLPSYRSQASGEYDDANKRTNTCKHKHRVVSMYDLGVVVVELKWAKPFQEFFGGLPIYAGGKDNRDISMIILDRHSRLHNWLSLDYSSFDTSVSNWLIEDAFDLVKSCFQLTDAEEKLFDVMVNSFINKTFVLAEGYLKSTKGVPSGSMWTQIIDTLVNLIIGQTYYYAKLEKRMVQHDFQMIAMGDDNLIQTRMPIDRADIASYISKNFGMVVNADKSEQNGENEVSNFPKFLARSWTSFGQDRPCLQVFSRMLFPERPRGWKYKQGAVDPILVIYSYVLTYPLAMRHLMNVAQFLRDNESKLKAFTDDMVLQNAPGGLTYLMVYGGMKIPRRVYSE